MVEITFVDIDEMELFIIQKLIGFIFLQLILQTINLFILPK